MASLCPPRAGTHTCPASGTACWGGGEGHRNGLAQLLLWESPGLPQKRAPRTGPTLQGRAETRGRGTCCPRPCRGKVNESLCFLATVLTPPTTYPWGAEEGLPVPG